MAVNVETLEKLERKVTLTLPINAIEAEVDTRLKRLARQVKIDGFRPGKVPAKVVAQMYGASVQYEVMNDKVGEAFAAVAVEAQLRVAGAPQISQKDGAAEGEMAFEAVFEVYPEVKMGDLATVEVEKVTADVTEEAIDKTVDILRKQRRTFAQRAAADAAVDGDRATIDFLGSIDGVPFEGGKADGFQFILGDGQMLKEFEDAVRGMKSGESKTFPLAFPEDYHGKDVAGKTADFLVTVHKVEAANLPEVDEAFVKTLGVNEPTVEALRADIRNNLEREVKNRLQARNKAAAMDAMVAKAELDLPKAPVQAELDRMADAARADLKQRGIKDADKAPIPDDIFRPQAERRVRLGLVVAELVRTEKLDATREQIEAHINEMAAAYERPADVVKWYTDDQQRMSEVEAVVIENNVTAFILAKAKVTEKAVDFDELMAQQ
ncbi:MAG: trigger factor [Burkholderiaceae bacterium]|nr:trigger factor [Burkholderiaceae bacterium]MDA9885299.1 trigger factor [Burkholderiaceae bacterium]MDO7552873.1 trigger factor [Burkholderiaceae bacterium]MDO7578743.1 trigger factor [Burkholderiaceae bacterium]MDO7594021.1 trigger factor [Burkholderiaceae bacterium]